MIGCEITIPREVKIGIILYILIVVVFVFGGICGYNYSVKTNEEVNVQYSIIYDKVIIQEITATSTNITIFIMENNDIIYVTELDYGRYEIGDGYVYSIDRILNNSMEVQ